MTTRRCSIASTTAMPCSLADSLIYRLSQLPNLKVSPTSSVMRYKGKGGDTSQIAKELNVDAVMSGRLVQIGESLNISVQLTDARTDKLIWAEQYDRKMSDLLATQREIAMAITERLQLKLTGDDAKGITKRYTDNNEAYQLYLKGRYHFARRTKDDNLRSIELFEQATRLDPGFALAHAAIAECYTVMPSHAHMSPMEASPKAKEAIRKALAADPSLAEAHAINGNIITNFDWDWARAEIQYNEALKLDPNSATSHYRYGQHLAGIGKLDKSIEHLSRAIELEPLSGNNNATLALVYFYAGQSEKGLQLARQTYDLDPSVGTARLALGSALLESGRFEEAIQFSENILTSEPTNQHMLMVVGNAYALSGRQKNAEEIIQRFRHLAKTQYVSNGYIASIYGAIGQKDLAFAELEAAFEKRDWWITRIRSDPRFAPIRSDPRFQAMLRRLNLPE